MEYLKSQHIQTLDDVKKLLPSYVNKLDINEVERYYLDVAIKEIDEDFSEGFITKKLLLRELNNENTQIEISWAGIVIGTNKNVDVYLHMEEQEKSNQKQENIELTIKYQYGSYWLIPTNQNEANIFVLLKQDDYHYLIPDDIINMGDLDFLVQRFNTGHYEDQGTRIALEDVTIIRQELGLSYNLNVSYYAVYDGHGGIDCVKYVAEFLVENLRMLILKSQPSFDEQTNFYRYIHDNIVSAIKTTDSNFYKEYGDYALDSGCTANICLIVGDRIFCVNIGDSRAIISRNGIAYNLSRDHKPYNPDEQERITHAKGYVEFNRVFGKLAVSRAFGDFKYKPIGRGDKSTTFTEDLVITDPEIRVFRIDYLQDEFILMACDGLFDVFSNQQCVNFIREKLTSMKIMEQDPKIIAKDLAKEAIEKSTILRKNSDNVSTCIITLNRGIQYNMEKSIIK